MEYLHKIVFENNKISAFIEFLDSALLKEVFTNETIAAGAELHCSK